MKYDVFISYSRKDTAIADQICAAFEKVGITYFIDRQGIVGSGEFPEILADAILESRFFLFLASQNSYSSKYTKKEIHFAFNKKPSGTLFPYIIDESVLPNSIELVFSDINIRSIKVHPIETVLVDDMLRLLGRTRPKDNINTTYHQKTIVPSTPEAVKEIKLTPKEKNGKYGFIDEQGKVIISFEYEKAMCFSEGLAAVQNNGKWGFIDKQGNMVIPFEYENAWLFSEGLAAVAKKKTIINNNSYFVWDVGFIDKQGNIVIPFEYGFPYFGGFKNGLCCICKNDEDHIGFIDKKGNVIIPLIYGSFDCDWDGKHYYFDPFHEGLISALKGPMFNHRHEYNEHSKWGYLDRQGKTVIPFCYSYAGPFQNGRAKVTKKYLFGKEQTFYIDKQGNRID